MSTTGEGSRAGTAIQDVAAPAAAKPSQPPVGVTWLGHSTAVLDIGTGAGALRLVTDPLLHRHAGMLRRRGQRPAQVWQGADAVLLSHLHHDHAELRSLRLLGGAPVLTAPSNARWLRRRGLNAVGLGHEWHHVDGRVPPAPPTAGALTGPAPGFSVDAPTQTNGRRIDVCIHLAEAVHGHRPMVHRPNAANGHLIRVDWADGSSQPGSEPASWAAELASQPSTWAHAGPLADVASSGSVIVWVVGDTEHYPAMAHLPQLAGGMIDLALIPVGGWGPKLSGGHLDPLRAAQVCAEVGIRHAIPVHWGTLHAPGGQNLPRGWMDHAGTAFEHAVARVAPQCQVTVLQPGDTWAL